MYKPPDLPIDNWWVTHRLSLGDSSIEGVGLRWSYYMPKFWWWFMGMTPEGRVKKYIIKILELYKADGLYHFMPVPSGFGESSLDFIGCFKGKFFAIEAKAPGKKPSALQDRMIERIKDSGGMAFVISEATEEAVASLRLWLEVNRQ